jgi:hypothetical protein
VLDNHPDPEVLDNHPDPEVLDNHPGPEVLDNHPDPAVSDNHPGPEVSDNHPDLAASDTPAAAVRRLAAADNQLAAVRILTDIQLEDNPDPGAVLPVAAADIPDPAADIPDPAVDNPDPAVDNPDREAVLPVAAADTLDSVADTLGPAEDNLSADSWAGAVLQSADNSAVVADSPVAAVADNPEEATRGPAADSDIRLSEVPNWVDNPVAAPLQAVPDNQAPADNRAADSDSPMTASANNPGVDPSAEHSRTARDARISRPNSHLKDSDRIRWFCYRPL